MIKPARDAWVPLGIGVGETILYLIGLQAAHIWGGDFAHYILHARNLVEGIPYSDTGYRYRPPPTKKHPEMTP